MQRYHGGCLPRNRAGETSCPPVRRGVASTLSAADQRAQMAGAAFRADHPWPVYPRRLVAHMPIVAAFEFGHPVPLAVLTIADDAPLHAGIITRRRPCPVLRRRTSRALTATRRRRSDPAGAR